MFFVAVSMAYFLLSNITSDSATITVYNVVSGSEIRVFARYADDADSSVLDRTYSDYQGATLTQNIYSLSPETSYLANVNIDGSWLVAKSFETESEAPVRPNNFSWSSSKVSGQEVNITAYEWNSFTSRINDFLEYKGLSDSYFTTAFTGNQFTASMYNQARTAIQRISGYGTYIPSAVSGENLTAYDLNVIVSELNSIP